MNPETLALVGSVLVLLIAATAGVFVLKRRTDIGLDPALVQTFWVRVRAWWLLFAGLAGAFVIGQAATVVLFGLISFWALREFITVTPTRPGESRRAGRWRWESPEHKECGLHRDGSGI